MNRLMFFVGLLATACSVQAVPQTTLDLTEAREYVGKNGETFRYRWHQPKAFEDGKRYPFVFLMHGAGERGTNNVAQLQWGAKDVLEYAVASKDDCFFLAGQVPVGRRWVEVNWGDTRHTMPTEPSQTMQLQIELAESLFAELPVDTNRVYATGVSMGGYGTWDLISRRPEWFAAAMPVCGGMDLEQAPKLKDVAIWIHHGDRDTIVPFVRSRLATEALWHVNGNVKYTEYPGVHHASWVQAYGNRDNLRWLFSQRKAAR